MSSEVTRLVFSLGALADLIGDADLSVLLDRKFPVRWGDRTVEGRIEEMRPSDGDVMVVLVVAAPVTFDDVLPMSIRPVT